MAVTIFLSATNVRQIATHLRHNADYAGTLYLNLTTPTTNDGIQVVTSLICQHDVLEELQRSIAVNTSITKLVISASSSMILMPRHHLNAQENNNNSTEQKMYDMFREIIESLAFLPRLVDVELQLIHETYWEQIVGPAMVPFLKNARHLKRLSLNRVSFGALHTSSSLLQQWSHWLSQAHTLQEFQLELCRIDDHHHPQHHQQYQQQNGVLLLTPLVLALAQLPSLTKLTLIGFSYLSAPSTTSTTIPQLFSQSALVTLLLEAPNLTHIECRGWGGSLLQLLQLVQQQQQQQQHRQQQCHNNIRVDLPWEELMVDFFSSCPREDHALLDLVRPTTTMCGRLRSLTCYTHLSTPPIPLLEQPQQSQPSLLPHATPTTIADPSMEHTTSFTRMDNTPPTTTRKGEDMLLELAQLFQNDNHTLQSLVFRDVPSSLRPAALDNTMATNTNTTTGPFIESVHQVAVLQAFLDALESNYTLEQCIFSRTMIACGNTPPSTTTTTNTNDDDHDEDNNLVPVLQNRLAFYLRLNQQGRGTILKHQQTSPHCKRVWVDKIIHVKDDLNDLLYYLLANPTILFSDQITSAR